MPAHMEALSASLDEKGADSPGSGLAGTRPDDDHARSIAGGAPLLAPVDHVPAAGPPGGGSNPSGVGAGVGLREAEAGGNEAPRGDLRHVTLLLLLGPEAHD